MQRFVVGDRVRIDIPDETDPDHEVYHGTHGLVIETLTDAGDAMTGDKRDRLLYRIELDSWETADFRWQDLRPPTDE